MVGLKFQGTGKYYADDRLAAIVNLAIGRGRPLLITGEAGTGKTELASAIAEALGLKLELAQMTSTMQGEEVCYTYDAILRLTDAQLSGRGLTVPRNIEHPMEYVRYGAVGRAFVAEEKRVVLLDEIDKTTSDVQDNLLRILGCYEFEVREAACVVQAKQKPIIIVTSNGKRELSDAFLRRCYAHHIDFPDQNGMNEIVRRHYPDARGKLLEHAIQVFYELRELGLEKPPATAELLDWYGALNQAGYKGVVGEHPLPFAGVLLKRGVDVTKYHKQGIPSSKAGRW